ncbi:MAG: sigma 54-dependent Fis family transcriptional regulator [Polyangiaceae bacterium]|nr:sigma 54-dependent Fis family transcriptional regulator [Polyangiaceae bacterium]
MRTTQVAWRVVDRIDRTSCMQYEPKKSMWLAESQFGFCFVYRHIHIQFIRGPCAGEVLELAGPEVRMGSGESCDIIIPDRTVSHVHAILRIEGDALRVIDANSKNGTHIDNVRIRDAYIEPGSALTMGTSTARIRLLAEVVELPPSNFEHFGNVIGRSIAMRNIFAVIDGFARTQETLLIEGAPGTGKTTIAAAIHAASARCDEPFVMFDCSTMPKDALEIDLFGGISSGTPPASALRRGRLDEADGGTLVLQHVDALPIELQSKLLGALDWQIIRPLGTAKAWRLDVRIIATTTRDLANEMNKNRFREDLHQRLAMRSLRLPPLRDRAEDIPILARYFEKAWRLRTGKRASLSDSVLEELKLAGWPGNVRELRSTVEDILTHERRGAR